MTKVNKSTQFNDALDEAVRRSLKAKISNEGISLKKILDQTGICPAPIYKFMKGTSSPARKSIFDLVFYLEGYFDIMDFLIKFKKDNAEKIKPL